MNLLISFWSWIGPPRHLAFEKQDFIGLCQHETHDLFTLIKDLLHAKRIALFPQPYHSSGIVCPHGFAHDGVLVG